MAIAFALALGTALGAIVVWLALRARVREAERLGGVEAEAAALRASLAHEQTAAAEKLAVLEHAKEELATSFKALCADALRSNNTSFVELARAQLDQRERAVQQLVAPLRESLEKVNTEVQTLERARRQDYGALSAELRRVAETNERVRVEAAGLATALRASEVRGAWGEMQLRNAVETAGMLAFCDFLEQVTVAGETRLRPDLVVRLPGGRRVVVDAKAPLKPLLDAVDASDEAARATALGAYGRHVREHVAKLSAKAYWQQFDPAPDFVVMFLPGESFYRAALEQEPGLLELQTRHRVIVAGPTILITLLKTIAVGWREEKVAESARAVSELGRELYERLAVLSEHFVTLGKRLDGAVQAYNQSVGSLERRVLVQARRFTEHGI
ncbi:MAG TPA: DNA recombination protein RmuC, partial [Gaiellaceae bacterium]